MQKNLVLTLFSVSLFTMAFPQEIERQLAFDGKVVEIIFYPGNTGLCPILKNLCLII